MQKFLMDKETGIVDTEFEWVVRLRIDEVSDGQDQFNNLIEVKSVDGKWIEVNKKRFDQRTKEHLAAIDLFIKENPRPYDPEWSKDQERSWLLMLYREIDEVYDDDTIEVYSHDDPLYDPSWLESLGYSKD